MTKYLNLITNVKSTLTAEQTQILKTHKVEIIQDEIESLEHQNGNVQQIIFKNQTKIAVKAIYFKAPFEQHCPLPKSLGCELTENGLLKVDAFQKTTIPGVFTSGDCHIQARSVALAVSSGSFAGAMINKEIIDEEFV